MSDSDLDPSIAALLRGAAPVQDKDEAAVSTDTPPAPAGDSAASKSMNNVDLSVKAFKPITKFFEDTPSHVFDDPSYYKTALTGEDQSAQRVHAVLTKYLTCKDPKDRTIYRQQLVTAYWDLVSSIMPKMAVISTPVPKRMMLRFGVLLPSLFTAEQKEMFSKVI